MCVWGGGGVAGVRGSDFLLVLRKNVTASGGVGGCFARSPSFTLTLSDSILSNLTTKIKII